MILKLYRYPLDWGLQDEEQRIVMYLRCWRWHVEQPFELPSGFGDNRSPPRAIQHSRPLRFSYALWGKQPWPDEAWSLAIRCNLVTNEDFERREVLEPDGTLAL